MLGRFIASFASLSQFGLVGEIQGFAMQFEGFVHRFDFTTRLLDEFVEQVRRFRGVGAGESGG